MLVLYYKKRVSKNAGAYNARKAGFSIFGTPRNRFFACFLVLFGDAFRSSFIGKNVVFGASRAIFDYKTRLKLILRFSYKSPRFLIKRPSRDLPKMRFCYKTAAKLLPERSIFIKHVSENVPFAINPTRKYGGIIRGLRFYLFYSVKRATGALRGRNLL